MSTHRLRVQRVGLILVWFRSDGADGRKRKEMEAYLRGEWPILTSPHTQIQRATCDHSIVMVAGVQWGLPTGTSTWVPGHFCEACLVEFAVSGRQREGSNKHKEKGVE